MDCPFCNSELIKRPSKCPHCHSQIPLGYYATFWGLWIRHVFVMIALSIFFFGVMKQDPTSLFYLIFASPFVCTVSVIIHKIWVRI